MQIIGGHEQEQVIMQSDKYDDDAWNNMVVKAGAIKEEEVEEGKEIIE